MYIKNQTIFTFYLNFGLSSNNYEEKKHNYNHSHSHNYNLPKTKSNVAETQRLFL